MARVVAVLAGWTTCPARRSTGTARPRCRPPGWPSTRSRPARATSFVSAGVECVSRYKGFAGAGQGNEDWLNPLFADAEARSAASPTSNDTWHDPRQDGQVPDVYIAMGQTAGEPRALLKDVSRARRWTSSAWRARTCAEKAITDGFWEREITPVTTPDGTVVSKDDGPRARRHPRGVSGLQAGLPRPTAG